MVSKIIYYKLTNFARIERARWTLLKSGQLLRLDAMKYSTFIIFLVFMLLSSDLYALSCSSLNERIVVECSNGKCIRGTFVYDVSSFGACGRRPIVEEAEPWQVNIAAKLVKSNFKSTPDIAAFEIIYESRWYEHKRMHSEKELMDLLVSKIKYYPKAADFVQRYFDNKNGELLNDASFYRVLNELWLSYTGSGLVKKSENNYKDITERWHKKEEKLFFEHRMKVVFDWGLLCIGSILLLLSVYYYFRMFSRHPHQKYGISIVKFCLAYQFTIFFFSLYWILFNSWDPMKLVILGPIVLLICFIELSYVSVKYFKTQHNLNSTV